MKIFDSLAARFILLSMGAVLLTNALILFAVQTLNPDPLVILQQQARESLIQEVQSLWTAPFTQEDVDQSVEINGVVMAAIDDVALIPADAARLTAPDAPQFQAFQIAERLAYSSILTDLNAVEGSSQGSAGPYSRTSFDDRRRDLYIAAQDSAGTWITVTVTAAPILRPPVSRFAFFLIISLFVTLTVVVLATRSLFKPLRALEDAAMHLGSGHEPKPVAESGPADIRSVTQAFNSMARRIDALLTSQRDILMALGHDLRTPMTSLRVRIEQVENPQRRERMISSMTQLEHLAEAALVSARGERFTEEFEMVDLISLVESVVDDLPLTDDYLSVDMPEGRVKILAVDQEIRRAVWNVIENAIRYGKSAKISVFVSAEAATVRIDDDGPGIPEEELKKVLAPLYRLEPSRSLNTGGHGLGLFIVHRIIKSHGGKLHLENLKSGGLRVEMRLPTL